MFFGTINGSASGGGGNAYVEYGHEVNSDPNTCVIDLGFAPKMVFIVEHFPNYTYPLCTVFWSTDDSSNQYFSGWNNSPMARKYSMPYPTDASMIKSINGSVVTYGYNSAVGANQTLDIFAVPAD